MTVLEGERKALNLLGCSENVLVKMENILLSNSVIVLIYYFKVDWYLGASVVSVG